MFKYERAGTAVYLSSLPGSNPTIILARQQSRPTETGDIGMPCTPFTLESRHLIPDKMFSLTLKFITAQNTFEPNLMILLQKFSKKPHLA
jgi:hypothetical protein